MATQTPAQYNFKAVKCFKQVRHYQSEKKLTATDLLTTTINISKDREFNNSRGVSYWLKIRDVKKWSKAVTGLKRTSNQLLYYGDIATSKNGVHKPTHLLIFKFTPGGKELLVFLYKHFYPKNNTELQSILSKYK